MSRPLPALLAATLLCGIAAPVAAADPKPVPGATDAASTAAPPPAAGTPVPGEVLVGWRDPGAVGEVLRARGLTLAAERVDRPEVATAVSTAGRPVDAVLAELRADPRVEYAEPSYTFSLAEEGSVAVATNDPMTGNQYSLDRMRVRDAWSLSTGGNGVVAVLDTGVQFNHPDLAGRLLAGYDFVNDDTNASDDNGHGTWVSGIIAAKANDGYGIAGISWSDKILPIKIMNREGTGSTSDLLSAIVWATDHGATVINMSVGGFPYSQAIQDAVTYAWSKGVVLVGAAGNNNREERFYPASYANVVSVSATQVNDEFSFWSSYGPDVDVSAPGSSVLTTNCYTCTYAGHDTWGSHTYISGTSFATPNVAGVVALLRARFPTESPSQIVTRLTGSVDDLGYGGRDNRYGLGRVNALRALGGTAAAAARPAGDALEPNNVLAAAKVIPLGSATKPTIYPAGDADLFAVDVPRAGRLDVRVTGVVDSRDYPWNRSALPVDPIVELYTTAGVRLVRVDNEWETGTELASTSVTGPTRIVVRVTNYYANGSRTAYSVTPTYVDTVAPKIVARAPAAGAVHVSRWLAATVRWDEPVKNVSASTVLLRDTVTGNLVPATVGYDAGQRTATLTVSEKLAAERLYRVEVTTGVTDTAGNRTAASSWTFTTGISGYRDTIGSPFEYDIAWLTEAGITAGCGDDRFCPKATVTREQMASFLARGLALAPSAADPFTDDETSAHEADINRLAAAGVTGGCAPTRFCPTAGVTREQMASFLARALELPPATRDHFADDETSAHEADINRLAEAGITGGCSADSFCPGSFISREQMAAFLHRALGD